MGTSGSSEQQCVALPPCVSAGRLALKTQDFIGQHLGSSHPSRQRHKRSKRGPGGQVYVCVCVCERLCVSEQEGAVTCIINELILLLLLSKEQKAWTQKAGLARELEYLNENNSGGQSL